MKTMLKLALMVALFTSFALADGDMGSGGYQGCTGDDCPPPPICTVNCGSAMAAGDGSVQPSGVVSIQTPGNGSWIAPSDVIFVFVGQAFRISF